MVKRPGDKTEIVLYRVLKSFTQSDHCTSIRAEFLPACSQCIYPAAICEARDNPEVSPR